jgi:hypothetical protein
LDFDDARRDTLIRQMSLHRHSRCNDEGKRMNGDLQGTFSDLVRSFKHNSGMSELFR